MSTGLCRQHLRALGKPTYANAVSTIPFISYQIPKHLTCVCDIRSLALELIQKHLETSRAFVDAMLEVERMPFTQNTHYLQSQEDEWRAKYKNERLPDADSDVDEDDINEALSILARVGHAGLKEEDLGRLHAADEYQTEMDVMAEVRGYFQVSYKVFTISPCRHRITLTLSSPAEDNRQCTFLD